MNQFVVNILPDNLPKLSQKHDHIFNFLDIFDDDYFINNYYNLLKSLDVFKIKNVYHYIYLRIILINKIYPEIDCLEKKTNLTLDVFNNTLKSYIFNSEVKAIIIMNSIQQYFKPIKNI